eukprot:CAMPEP_0114549970 /NCGR_PEP_ID=MMETSP0114-20121206/5815_1 /TAXON_ID=31324 /ORGANISM="Goniomonas sp, Strain m" /LENGTH=83 /DNA_ID=CAMNT_0001734695 /DNA_START=1022 /DNA_END=1273 /DNA_ORIENTATION=-
MSGLDPGNTGVCGGTARGVRPLSGGVTCDIAVMSVQVLCRFLCVQFAYVRVWGTGLDRYPSALVQSDPGAAKCVRELPLLHER